MTYGVEELTHLYSVVIQVTMSSMWRLDWEKTGRQLWINYGNQRQLEGKKKVKENICYSTPK